MGKENLELICQCEKKFTLGIFDRVCESCQEKIQKEVMNNLRKFCKDNKIEISWTEDGEIRFCHELCDWYYMGIIR